MQSVSSGLVVSFYADFPLKAPIGKKSLFCRFKKAAAGRRTAGQTA